MVVKVAALGRLAKGQTRLDKPASGFHHWRAKVNDHHPRDPASGTTGVLLRARVRVRPVVAAVGPLRSRDGTEPPLVHRSSRGGQRSRIIPSRRSDSGTRVRYRPLDRTIVEIFLRSH